MIHFSLYNQKEGFSLVETLVAITILLIIIVGPMSIASSTTRSTEFANQQINAYFLAQEGIELAQKARDDKWLARWGDDANPDGWNEFVDDTGTGDYEFCFAVNGCGLEIDDDPDGSIQVVQCGIGDCRLYEDDDITNRSRFTHDPGGTSHILTDFTRVITMDNSVSGQVEVVSRVSWRTGNQFNEQSLELTTYLFNVYNE